MLKTNNIDISLFKLAELLIALIAIYKVSFLLMLGKNLLAFDFTFLPFQHFPAFLAFPSISQHLAAKCGIYYSIPAFGRQMLENAKNAKKC